ncbi:GNAT family N-acetyltransferase [Chloroflexota bacterium]
MRNGSERPDDFKTERLNVRRMDADEVEFAIDLAASEGWNPGIHDGRCFYATDNDGFFLGELDGEPIGCVSAVTYGNDFGFMGLYVVRPEFRDKGLGTRIFETGLEYMAGRNVGGNSVLHQEEYYKAYGFRRGYHNSRYQGTGGGNVPSGVMDVSQVSFDDLLDYDTALFGHPRPEFLRCWIDQPEGAAMAIVKNGRLAGYGVIRRCHTGYKVAPLFADREQIAEDLFVALKSGVPGQPIFLDVPERNPAAIVLAERHDMTVVFQTIRVYIKGEPSIPLERWYGVTSFELG